MSITTSRRGRKPIRKLADEAGVTPEEFVQELITKHGGVYPAAAAIGFVPNALYYWLDKAKLRPIVTVQVTWESTE